MELADVLLPLLVVIRQVVKEASELRRVGEVCRGVGVYLVLKRLLVVRLRLLFRAKHPQLLDNVVTDLGGVQSAAFLRALARQQRSKRLVTMSEMSAVCSLSCLVRPLLGIRAPRLVKELHSAALKYETAPMYERLCFALVGDIRVDEEEEP